MLDSHLSRSVEVAKATGESLAAIGIDLDGFKTVNDIQDFLIGRPRPITHFARSGVLEHGVIKTHAA